MIGCLTSKSEAVRHYLLAGFFQHAMAAENRFVVFVLISFNGIEGILKDNATTQKCSKKAVKVF